MEKKFPPKLRLALGAVVAAAPLLLVATLAVRHADRIADPVAPAARVAQEEAPKSGPSVREVLAGSAAPDLRAQLEQIYGAVDGATLWSGDETAKRRLRSLDEELSAIDAQGLNTAKLVAAREALLASKAEDRARNDIALTSETLTLAKAIRFGHLSNKQLPDWEIAADVVDITPDFAAALKDGQLGPYLRSLEPTDPQYANLVKALARYKDLVGKGGGPAPASEDAEAFRSRLIAEGYLVANAPADKVTLQAALKDFQTHNGLEPDGKLGKATLAALTMSADQRVG